LGAFRFRQEKPLIAPKNASLIANNFGAGDRGRTGDVQLGNFVSNLVVFLLNSNNLATILASHNFFLTFSDFNWFRAF
jgi:hypothetical protein